MLTRTSTLPMRSLALAVSLFLALPPGWCCSAVAAFAFSSSEEAAKKSCCCCVETPAQTPAQSPAKAPPVDPCSSPCCERLPTLLVAAYDGVQDFAAPIMVAVIEFPPPPAVESVSPFVPVDDSSPPLRILLCTWLC